MVSSKFHMADTVQHYHGSSSTSVAVSTFNLAKTIIGSGILALPSGVSFFSNSKSILPSSLVMLGFMGFLSAYSFRCIGLACSIHNTTTYAEAWTASTGIHSGALMPFVIVFKTFFTCLAFSIIIGILNTVASFNYLPYVHHFFHLLLLFSGDTCFSLSIAMWPQATRLEAIVVTTILGIAPLCLFRNTFSANYTSVLGLVANVYCAWFMVTRYLDGSYDPGGIFSKSIEPHLRPIFGNTTEVLYCGYLILFLIIIFLLNLLLSI